MAKKWFKIFMGKFKEACSKAKVKHKGRIEVKNIKIKKIEMHPDNFECLKALFKNPICPFSVE